MRDRRRVPDSDEEHFWGAADYQKIHLYEDDGSADVAMHVACMLELRMEQPHLLEHVSGAVF